MSPRATSLYSKKEFIYECCLRGLQGSLSNPNQQASIASIVRDACLSLSRASLTSSSMRVK